MIRSPLFQKRVCCIAIDEAHMVQEWGEDFRKDFSKLDDLIALFPKCPHVVVTATASATTQQQICKTLQLRNVCHVTINPDRPNIKYSNIKRSPSNEDGLDSLLEKLVEELKQDILKFPLTLVYTDLESVQYCYSFMSHALQEYQYLDNHAKIPENRVFAQYHRVYTEDMKTHIVCDLTKKEPTTRLVFATVALGMGLDAPSIRFRRIIHFKPPVSVEQYLQETGRDGQCSEAILYWNNMDIRSNRPGIKKAMIKYCRNEDSCLRSTLLNELGFEPNENRKLCCCCSICDQIFVCSDCE